MEDHNVAIGQLLVAHEQDLQTLGPEIETLTSEVQQLRADLLASLKYTHPVSHRAHPATAVFLPPTTPTARGNLSGYLSLQLFAADAD